MSRRPTRSPSSRTSGCWRLPARPSPAQTTTLNSRPLAACMVMSCTASWPSTSTGASVSTRVGLELGQRRGRRRRARRVPRAPRSPPRAAGACARWPAAARRRGGPAGARRSAVARTTRSSSSSRPWRGATARSATRRATSRGRRCVVVAAQPRPQRVRVALHVRGHEQVPERRLARGACQPQQGQRVAADAAQRRGQDAEERGLVARVGQRREPREEVADLAAAPPAAPAARERREADVLQGALDRRQRPQGTCEHHDLARPALARVDERAHALGDQARLGRQRRPVGVEARPQGRRELRGGRRRGRGAVRRPVPGRGVGEQQLDAPRRVGRLDAARHERDVALAVAGAEGVVERGQEVGPRPEARGQLGRGPARRELPRGGGGRPRRRRGGTRRSTAARRRRRTSPRRRGASRSSSCSGFVSWNSSTITRAKRSRSAAATAGWSRSRSRATSSRSAKSTADRARLAAA